MMTKPTEGPYTLAERGDYSDFDGNSRVILGDDRRIAVVQHSGKAEDEANARLLAKSWEMREALTAWRHATDENACFCDSGIGRHISECLGTCPPSLTRALLRSIEGE